MPSLADRIENQKLVTIYEISKILGSSFDLSKTLREVLNVLTIHLEACRGMIILMQPSGELHLVSAVGLSDEAFLRCQDCVGEGMTGKIFHSGMPSVVSDISQEPLLLSCTDKHASTTRKNLA